MFECNSYLWAWILLAISNDVHPCNCARNFWDNKDLLGTKTVSLFLSLTMSTISELCYIYIIHKKNISCTTFAETHHHGIKFSLDKVNIFTIIAMPHQLSCFERIQGKQIELLHTCEEAKSPSTPSLCPFQINIPAPSDMIIHKVAISLAIHKHQGLSFGKIREKDGQHVID